MCLFKTKYKYQERNQKTSLMFLHSPSLQSLPSMELLPNNKYAPNKNK